MDGSYKAIKLDPTRTSVEELWEILSDKLMLTPTSCVNFFVWGIAGDMELLLYTHQKVANVFTDWHIYEDRYNPQHKPTVTRTIRTTLHSKISKSVTAMGFSSISPTRNTSKIFNSMVLSDSDALRMVFRTTSILPLSIEQQFNDPGAVHLFYIQAVYNVVHSNYPSEIETAIELGGIQLQLTVGDRNQQLHTLGYLQEEDVLSQYVPEHLKSELTPADWESRLFTQHDAHRGKDPFVLKLEYLGKVRKWPHYQCTFFKAVYLAEGSFYKQLFEGKVRVGVNQYGLHLIDPKILQIVMIRFREIINWGSERDVFWVEVKEENTTRSLLSIKKIPNKMYMFRSPQAELINDSMHDWKEAIENFRYTIPDIQQFEKRFQKKELSKSGSFF